MASVCTNSASKQRRLRAAATKKKLYESSQRADKGDVVKSQLEMLTAAVFNLQSILDGAIVYVPYSSPTFDPFSLASEFQCSNDSWYDGEGNVQSTVQPSCAPAGDGKLCEAFFTSTPGASTEQVQDNDNKGTHVSSIFPRTRGDFRSIPAAAWSSIHMLFDTKVSDGPTNDPPVSNEEVSPMMESGSPTSMVPGEVSLILFLKLMADGLLSQVEFYPQDRIVVANVDAASRNFTFARIADGEVARVLEVVVARHIAFVSYLEARFPLNDCGKKACACSAQDDESEEAPEFTNVQMQAIIEMAAAQFMQHPTCESIPEDFFAAEVAKLKDMYEEKPNIRYTRSQARRLMELTGDRCAKVLLKLRQ